MIIKVDRLLGMDNGDVRSITLKNSSMIFRYSTKIWEREKPSETQNVEPDYVIDLSINDILFKGDSYWKIFEKITKKHMSE